MSEEVSDEIYDLYSCVLKLKLIPKQNWLDRKLGVVRLQDPRLGTILTAVYKPSTLSCLYNSFLIMRGNRRVRCQPH